MILAVAPDGMVRPPTDSGEHGRCPQCDQPVRGKHGEIVIAHWAHLAAADCETWSEPESDWHRAWKHWYLGAGHCVEVTLDRGEGQRHRADVITTAGVVVELQHGYLSPSKIHERERFYGRMIWLYDARRWQYEQRLHVGRDLGDRWRGLWFKHGGRSLAEHKRPIWLDLGDSIAEVRLGLRVTEKGTRLLGRIRTIADHPWRVADEANA